MRCVGNLSADVNQLHGNKRANSVLCSNFVRPVGFVVEC